MKKKVLIISLFLLIIPFLLLFNAERYLKNFNYKKVHFKLIDNLSKFINFDFNSNGLEEISFNIKKIIVIIYQYGLKDCEIALNINATPF